MVNSSVNFQLEKLYQTLHSSLTGGGWSGTGDEGHHVIIEVETKRSDSVINVDNYPGRFAPQVLPRTDVPSPRCADLETELIISAGILGYKYRRAPSPLPTPPPGQTRNN